MSNIMSILKAKLFNVIVINKYLQMRIEDGYSEKKLEAVRAKRIRKTVKASLAHELYRNKYKEAGLDPNSIKTQADLEKLPPLTKEEYRELVRTALEKDGEKYKYYHKDNTSGSTGVPLKTCLSPSEYAVVMARLLFIWNKNGFRVFTDSSMNISSPIHDMSHASKSVIQKLGLLRKYRLSATDSPEHVANEIARLRPDVLGGGKSVVSNILKYAAENGIEFPFIKFVSNNAEAMDDAAYGYIEKTIGSDSLVDIYSSIESGIMAYTLRRNRHKFYLLPLDYLYSIHDKSGNAADKGELFVTNLYLHTFPMINYKQGDFVSSFVDGDGKRYLTEIQGRADDFIITSDGKRYTHHHLFAFLVKSTFCDRYRIIQEDYDTIRMILVKNKNSEYTVEEIEGIFRQKLDSVLGGSGMKYIFDWVEEIPIDPNGKIRRIINKIEMEK